MAKKLSEQQKVLCEAKAIGLNDADACKKAKYKAKSVEACCNQVARMMRNDEFAKYLAELRAAAKSVAVMTLEERRIWLSQSILTPLSEIDDESQFCVEKTVRIETDHEGEKTADIEKIKKVDPLRAMDILNRLDGDYAPEKHEVEVNDLRKIIAKARAKSTS